MDEARRRRRVAVIGVALMGAALAAATSGCAGLQLQAGSAKFNAGVPVEVSGVVDPVAGSADATLVDEGTGAPLVSFGVRVNMPAVFGAAYRAIAGVIPVGAWFGGGAAAPTPGGPLEGGPPLVGDPT